MLYDLIQKVRTKLKGYKTIVINSLIGVPGILFYLYQELTASGLDVSAVVPAKYVGLVVAGIAVIGILLRLFTTGPLGSKAGLPEQCADPVGNVKEPL